MDGSGCTLPFPFDFSSSFSKVLSDDIDKHHEHSDIGHHEHQEECDHEQILHRDHLDCLMPTSDGSFVLTHGHVGNGKAHEHGRLIKVGESQGRSGNNSKRFFDLFQYQCPHNSSSNVNKDGLIHRTSAAAFAKCLHCSGAPEILELSEIAKPLLVEEQVIIPIDNCGIESIKWEKTVIDVLGICCPAEAPLVKKLLEPIPGVQEVSVNVATKTVTVHHDPIAVPPLRLGMTYRVFSIILSFLQFYDNTSKKPKYSEVLKN
jgi:copper chaperone CopZ